MKKNIYVLGISAFYHDSAAALLLNGDIIAAAQEERFTRVKGDSKFPNHAISFCLSEAGITEKEIDHIIFYENNFVKFIRLIKSYYKTAPRSFASFRKAMTNWLTHKLWMEKVITNELGINKRVLFGDHHMSHAASAYYPSPFEEAAIITIDGVGEHSTTTYGVGEGNKIKLLENIVFPNSLGLLYSAFTFYLGFKINTGEYKVMGLASYGKPIYTDTIKKELIAIKDDGSFVVNQKYFGYVETLKTTNDKFHKLFGKPPREPESKITQREMDLAASLQAVTDEVVEKMARHVRQITGKNYLVLAGGVALNVVTIGKLSSKKIFDKIWIQPASGDAGGALGAALWYWHMKLDNPRVVISCDSMKGAFLGTNVNASSKEDDGVLNRFNAVWETFDDEKLCQKIASEIAGGRVIAVARGRMEYGPRALGARSIYGDPRSDKMQTHMNLKIKFRESFRPFAPMVLEEDAKDYFDLVQESPYMLLAYPVKKERRITVNTVGLWGIELLKERRSDIPAVTHVDYSARVQTIDKTRNPFAWEIINNFKKLTGCSVIINTSFNVRSEPIVNSVEDAYKCFMITDIDSLVVGNRLFHKENQMKQYSSFDRNEILRRFELD